MATKKQCFHLVREQCKSLTASYRNKQEKRLSLLLTRQGEQLLRQASEIAAYDLVSCFLQRLLEVLSDCYYEQPSEEQALRLLLDGLTSEVLFLGSAKGQARGRGPLLGEASPTLENYHQSQAEALGEILLALGEMLAPVLTCYISRFVEEAHIQMLDAEPYWGETTRRTFVAETCQKLNNEGKLDASYALLAGSLLKIDYPRDIYSEEDRYRRCALPTLVRRLSVADLIAFIADLRVECADWGPSFIAFGGGLGAAQSLLERRAATIPVPKRSLCMKVFRDCLPLLERVGLVATHPEPCLFCQTYGDHCEMWQVTFPEGTTFGEATQTEYDQLQHSYCFSPTLSGGLPDGWCIFVEYSGIWEPDCPWALAVLDLSQELAEKRESEKYIHPSAVHVMESA